MKKIIVNYKKAPINEGDILLFRGKSLVSWIIQKAGDGQYSHAALATFPKCLACPEDREFIEVTEFREGYGGRTVSLETAYYQDLKENRIDVYRVSEPLKRLYFDNITNSVKEELFHFEPRRVTNIMRNMTGLPYGWGRIWWMAKKKMFGLRLFQSLDKSSNDAIIEKIDDIYPVCSTAVAYCYHKVGYDLVPNRADSYTEPNDLARSGLLNYLFTLGVS